MRQGRRGLQRRAGRGITARPPSRPKQTRERHVETCPRPLVKPPMPLVSPAARATGTAPGLAQDPGRAKTYRQRLHACSRCRPPLRARCPDEHDRFSRQRGIIWLICLEPVEDRLCKPLTPSTPPMKSTKEVGNACRPNDPGSAPFRCRCPSDVLRLSKHPIRLGLCLTFSSALSCFGQRIRRTVGRRISSASFRFFGCSARVRSLSAVLIDRGKLWPRVLGLWNPRRQAPMPRPSNADALFAASWPPHQNSDIPARLPDVSRD